MGCKWFALLHNLQLPSTISVHKGLDPLFPFLEGFQIQFPVLGAFSVDLDNTQLRSSGPPFSIRRVYLHTSSPARTRLMSQLPTDRADRQNAITCVAIRSSGLFSSTSPTTWKGRLVGRWDPQVRALSTHFNCYGIITSGYRLDASQLSFLFYLFIAGLGFSPHSRSRGNSNN